MARLGVQAIRFGVPFDVDPAARARTMAYLKKSFDELKKHNIAATIEIGAGQGGYPLNQPRPHLTDDGVMMQTRAIWRGCRNMTGEFGEFCSRYLPRIRLAEGADQRRDAVERAVGGNFDLRLGRGYAPLS